MATDRQTTGMAGEFLVVGQLFKRELQASLTLGNAKSIDVLAFNPRTERGFTVSVKTLRSRNCFQLDSSSLSEKHTYVFVLLNEPGVHERYFIVAGAEIIANREKFFGSSLLYSARQAVNFGPLKPYENNWAHFELRA